MAKKKVDNSKVKKLSQKEEFFCRQYIIDFNGQRSAEKAGYSKRTARSKASQLLTKVNIQEFITKLKDKRAEKVEVTADDVLRQLKILSNSNIADYVEFVEKEVIEKTTEGVKTHKVKELEFKTFDKLTPDQLLCIESIKNTKFGIELKLHGKDWTIEKINRHIGFYDKDNKQKTEGNKTIVINHNDKNVDLKL